MAVPCCGPLRANLRHHIGRGGLLLDEDLCLKVGARLPLSQFIGMLFGDIDLVG